MARQTRLIHPGVAVHVVQRGNNRQTCFRNDSDHMLYLLHLRELAADHDCAIHAYCLMPNHVHLLVTPAEATGLSSMMRNLGQRFVQYFNKAYGRTGTLWEGRFRSCIAESARYVLACYRYIELNPVRGGLVKHPSDFRWSSYRVNAEGFSDRTIAEHPEYTALGVHPVSRRNGYKALFGEALAASLLSDIRESTKGGYPLGSESFKAAMILPSGRRLKPGRPGRPIQEGKQGHTLEQEI